MDNNKFSRRSAIQKIAGTAALTSLSSLSFGADKKNELKTMKLKGNVNHSVCKWCYGNIPLEEMSAAAKKMGLKSIELLGPDDWPTLKKYGLECAMANGPGYGIPEGFNNPANHEHLISVFKDLIPKVAAAGYKKVICFSGNRNGREDEEGIENCVKGLKELVKIAEDHKVIMAMELLNSKVNHPDYQCDHTEWGVKLCDKIGSENFKLLYDIYHMQIMEGDVIATIQKYHPYIAHYHTGGVPGRAEIDETQELYYPAIMRAILETGFTGSVAQEFVPKKPDALKSLAQGVEICDV